MLPGFVLSFLLVSNMPIHIMETHDMCSTDQLLVFPAQLYYWEAMMTHLVLQALDGARQKNDSIKDEIWHELAQVQYLCWQQESEAALEKQQLLQSHMQHLLQQHHSRELATQVLTVRQHNFGYVCFGASQELQLSVVATYVLAIMIKEAVTP